MILREQTNWLLAMLDIQTIHDVTTILQIYGTWIIDPAQFSLVNRKIQNGEKKRAKSSSDLSSLGK